MCNPSVPRSRKHKRKAPERACSRGAFNSAMAQNLLCASAAETRVNGPVNIRKVFASRSTILLLGPSPSGFPGAGSILEPLKSTAFFYGKHRVSSRCGQEGKWSINHFFPRLAQYVDAILEGAQDIVQGLSSPGLEASPGLPTSAITRDADRCLARTRGIQPPPANPQERSRYLQS
jgi:hypothetical protein